jgi:uncharacterized protein
MTDLGLRQQDIDLVVSVLSTFPSLSEAIVFGSRAKGNYRMGSDVDIALKGENLNLDLINAVSFLLNEETTLPYKFDVLNYHSIRNDELLAHINRVGVSIYKCHG